MPREYEIGGVRWQVRSSRLVPLPEAEPPCVHPGGPCKPGAAMYRRRLLTGATDWWVPVPQPGEADSRVAS